jgi:hypothetical protein
MSKIVVLVNIAFFVLYYIVTRTILERMENNVLNGMDMYYTWKITDGLSE